MISAITAVICVDFLGTSFPWGQQTTRNGRRVVHRLTLHYRKDLNAARSSPANSSGSSQAAKWPPLSTSLK